MVKILDDLKFNLTENSENYIKENKADKGTELIYYVSDFKTNIKQFLFFTSIFVYYNNFIAINFSNIFQIIIKDQIYQIRFIKNNKTLDFNKNGEITEDYYCFGTRIKNISQFLEEDFVFYLKLKEGIIDV